MDYIIDEGKVTYLPKPSVVHYTHVTKAQTQQMLIKGKDGKYEFVLQTTNATSININNSKTNIKTIFNANDCVEKCKKVLGLKINEIAKLLNISRATLDLHRNGANIKNMDTYNHLYTFIIDVENLYGNSLKNNGRNVLINGKTLVRHLFENSDNLNMTMPILKLLSDKTRGMTVSPIEYEPSKLTIRTGHIGRFA